LPGKFIGRDIDVTTDGEVKQPVSFRLDNREYLIVEIMESWPDHGFGKNPPQRKRWYHRHHRNYYKVKTTEDEVFEIYYDRGVSLKHPEHKKWFLSRQF